MKKTLLFYSSLFLLSTVLFGFENPDPPKSAKSSASKPNVIVIMCDDLGYADVGFNGSTEIPTPNIDKIANEGVRFTNAHVTYSVCGPSRAGFITGRYPQRFGFERNPVYDPTNNGANMPGLPPTENTFAETLPASYNTGIIGKWHMGAHMDNHPLNRGFDEFYGHIGGGHRYLPDETGDGAWSHSNSYTITNENDSYRSWIMDNFNHINPNTMGSGTYLTDFFSDEAVDFIARHAADTDPFFLFLSYNAPHGPLQATTKYLNRFPGLSGNRKTYAAMVSAVDDGVGDILDQLVASGIDNNTLVFFLSDNGGKEAHGANNGNLRGYKGATFEGGWRVPFALRYKGNIPEGVDYHKPVSALDIFATTMALAEVSSPKPLDGVNLIPYVKGENTADPHSVIHLRKYDGGNHATIKNGYKLFSELHHGRHRLYDLNNDISENISVHDANLDIVDDLSNEREQWTAQLMDPIFDGITKDDQRPNKSKSPSDYLVNHNFERGNLDGWDTWNDAGGVNNSNNNVYTTGTSSSKVYSGKNAAWLPAGSAAGINQVTYLKANTTYQLKFWAKSSNGDEYRITVRDEETDPKVLFLAEPFTATTSYKEFTKTFTTGNTENLIQISFWWKNNGSKGELYIDDVEIIEVGSSQDQLRLKIDDTINPNSTYQAKAVELPITAWLGKKTWEIIDGTGSATIDPKGVITPTGSGTITVRVSANTSSKASKGLSSKISAPSAIVFHEKQLTITGTLDVDDHNLDNESSLFSMYGSNIVDNEITIKPKQHLNNVSINIFSVTGKLVFTKKYNNVADNIYTYKVDNLQSGLYFIKINTSNKHQILKFIKK